jgi:hypothetical protein
MTASRTSYLTIRNVPPRVASALRAESRRRRQSVNQTVIDLLGAATGVGQAEPATNGLEKLAGSWSEEEFDAFESTQTGMSQIDPEMWK